MVVAAIWLATALSDGVSVPGGGRDAPEEVVLPSEPLGSPSGRATTQPPDRLPVLASLATGPGTCFADSATSIACPRWSVESPWEVLGRPTVAGRQVVIGVGASVAALRTETGEVLWQTGLAHPLSAAPVVDGDVAVVVDDGGVVASLDRGTGRLLWRRSLGAAEARVAVTRNVVVVAGRGGPVLGLAPDDGTVRWSVSVSEPPSPPVADVTTAFVGDGNGQVRAIALTDGDVRWTVDADGWKVALADQDRVLVVSGFGGPLLGLDPQTGEQLWASDVDVGWATAHPLPDGSVAIQTGGQLRRVDTSDGTSRPLVDRTLEQDMAVGPDGLIYRWTTASRVDVVAPDGMTVWNDDTGLVLHDLAVDRAVDSLWMVATLGQQPTTVVGTLAPARPPADAIATVAADEPCPTTPRVDRAYRQVAAATQTEVAGLGTDRDPAVTMVMDLSGNGEPLTITGRRLDGPGRMGFRRSYDDKPRTTLFLSDNGRRSAPGWPPHWGIVASVSAPGCWAYEVTHHDGTTDQIVVEISPDMFEEMTVGARHEPHDLQ